jgi:hypothetical protein
MASLNFKEASELSRKLEQSPVRAGKGFTWLEIESILFFGFDVSRRTES